MTKMIDRATGVSMYVADNRVDEYLAAGHKLAADTPKADEEKPKRKRTTKK